MKFANTIKVNMILYVSAQDHSSLLHFSDYLFALGVKTLC